MTHISHISHILFDLGNTLIRFEGDWPEVFERATKSLLEGCVLAGMPVDAAFRERFSWRMADYYRQREEDCIEHSTLAILKRALEDFDIRDPEDQALQACLDAFYKVTQKHWRPFPEAIDVLRELKGRGFRMAILSNAAHDADVQQLVDKAGFRPYLDFVLTSAQIGLRKPHPATFQRAVEMWDTNPDVVMMVGDTLNADITGGRNAGMATAWVRTYADPATFPTGSSPVNATLEIDSLADLLDFLATPNRDA